MHVENVPCCRSNTSSWRVFFSQLYCTSFYCAFPGQVPRLQQDDLQWGRHPKESTLPIMILFWSSLSCVPELCPPSVTHRTSSQKRGIIPSVRPTSRPSIGGMGRVR